MAFVSVFAPPNALVSARPLRNPLSPACPSRRSFRPRVRPCPLPPAMTASDDNPPSATAVSDDTVPPMSSVPYEDEQNPKEVILDENIVGFCSIDPDTGKRLELSLREKESLFLDAMQSYFGGTSVLSNEEFDSLKEELTWQGSDLVSLSRDEFRFLDAAKAYEQGKTIMEDTEFDALKKKLFEQGSIVAIQRGPRCSIERQITFSDVIPDKKRTFVLFVPAGILMSLTWLSLAFEVTPLHRIDPVLSLIIGSPLIYLGARMLTNLVVPNAQIMVGDCPSCGRRLHVLFGNVLNKQGFETEADVKCDKCKAQLKVEKETSRMILMKAGN